LSKFSANKLTSNPGAGVGILLFGQPITFDVLRADGVVNGAGRASLSIGPVPGAKVISRESFCAGAQERVQTAITNNPEAARRRYSMEFSSSFSGQVNVMFPPGGKEIYNN
jgi:hypothetical protein